MQYQTMKRSVQTKYPLNRAGAAIVEFAVVLPILLLCFSTMIEITRILLLQNSADTACFEGARCAMVPGAKPEEAVVAAHTLLQAAGLRGSSVSVSPDVITEDTALIIVSVEVPVKKNAWITPFWFLPNSISSHVALVCERPPAVQLTAIPKLEAIDNALRLGLGSANILSIGSQNSSSGVASVGLNSKGVAIQAAAVQANIPFSGNQTSAKPLSRSNL